MTKEEAKKFGLHLLQGIMERNESYPVYANNVKQAIDALSESGSSEIQNDLEEAAVQAHIRLEEGGELSFLKVFEAGASWQREQMLKEAVEGTIICYNDDTYAVESCCFDNKEHHHHSGDRVRVIVLPKED